MRKTPGSIDDWVGGFAIDQDAFYMIQQTGAGNHSGAGLL